MKNIQKGFIVPLFIVIVLIVIVGGIYFYSMKENANIPDENNNINTSKTETMSIDLYLQDKEAAITSDCGITQKVTYQIPKTAGVADISLKMLFEDELSKYGVYDSVTIADGVAKVMLKSDTDLTGKPVSSLSSCESSHLIAVLNDTLTQYNTIKSVELYSPEGKIEF